MRANKHLVLGLAIQKDNAANADRKLRVNSIQEWTNFPLEQMAI